MNRLSFFILLGVLLSSTFAWSEPYFSGAQSLGLAGSGRAGMESAESAFVNPALLGFLKSEAQLNYTDGMVRERSHSTNMGITIVDSEAGNISPGALSYRKLRSFGGALSAPADGDLWHGALGKLISPQWGLGLSVYRLTYDSQGLDIPEQWNGSLGVIYLVTPNLGVAYVLDSPVKADDEVPEALRMNLRNSLGFYYSTEKNSRLRLDLSKQERGEVTENPDLAMSFEIKSADYVAIRFGHHWDGQTAENRLGAGIAFMGPRLKVEYGFLQNLKDSQAMHSVDLRIPF